MGAQESKTSNFTPDQLKKLQLSFNNEKKDLILNVMQVKSWESFLTVADDLFETRMDDFLKKYSIRFPRDKSSDLIAKLILNWNPKFSREIIDFISNSDKSIHDFKMTLMQNRTVKEIFSHNLRKAFYRETEILPELKGSRLKFDQIWILKQHIQEKQGWEIIYSTDIHGKNWTMFLEKVLLPQSCLIVIKDDDDFVFGVYVHSGLSINPKFHGTSHNFMFTLEPKFQIYHSTGLNSNYQYLNTGTQSLPNGIGFGGQIDYFGLFLNAGLSGKCDADPRSTTFNSPVLSSKKEFNTKSIEIISIIQKECLNDDPADSILANEQDAAFLEISGRALYGKHVVLPKN